MPGPNGIHVSALSKFLSMKEAVDAAIYQIADEQIEPKRPGYTDVVSYEMSDNPDAEEVLILANEMGIGDCIANHTLIVPLSTLAATIDGWSV